MNLSAAMQKTLTCLVIIFLSLAATQVNAVDNAKIPANVFLLKFIDSHTRRGIPLVEIEMFNALCLTSDNLGHIAIIEPDLAGKNVRIVIRGNGYRFPHLDFFGERATAVTINPGSSATIELEKHSIATRLYRITGSGRFRDSVIASQHTENDKEKLPGNVTGLDSAIPVVFNNRLYSFYGDTLGTDRINLSGSGAEIKLASPLVPETSMPLHFFTDQDGFARRMITTSDPGFIWIESVIPVKTDNSGREVLAARYVKHKTLEEADETGFALFNERLQSFSLIRRNKSDKHHKSAHACPVTFNGRTGYCLQPWERFNDDLTSFIKPEAYDYYTCLEKADGSNDKTVNLSGKHYRIKRNAKGQAVFSWQRGGMPFTPALQQKLQSQGILTNNDRWLRLTEIGSGRQIDHFSGSITFNSYRRRWVMITQGNTGEIWYSEADTFTGPWVYARKVLEHDAYNFYNPVQHGWFDSEGGRIIYFEGTYTAFFTAREHKKPRCDYNQVMYKLDLSDPRLALPSPIYRVNTGKNSYRLMASDAIASRNLWQNIEKIEFMAFTDNIAIPDLIPIFDNATESSSEPALELIPASADQPPLYYGLPQSYGRTSDVFFAEMLQRNGIGRCFSALDACLTFDPTIAPSDRFVIKSSKP